MTPTPDAPDAPDAGSVVVELDDARYGAGPGTVIAFCDTTEEYRAIHNKRGLGGGTDPRLRMWRSYAGARIGDRVSL